MALFSGKKKKDKGLYLSDKPPLTVAGIIGLVMSYTILIAWVVAIVWPLFQMVVSAFNGQQQQYIMGNENFLNHIKETISKEILEKIDDGDIINHVNVSDGIDLILVTKSIPNLKKVLLIDAMHNCVGLAEVSTPEVFENGEFVGTVQ